MKPANLTLCALLLASPAVSQNAPEEYPLAVPLIELFDQSPSVYQEMHASIDASLADMLSDTKMSKARTINGYDVRLYSDPDKIYTLRQKKGHEAIDLLFKIPAVNEVTLLSIRATNILEGKAAELTFDRNNGAIFATFIHESINILRLYAESDSADEELERIYAGVRADAAVYELANTQMPIVNYFVRNGLLSEGFRDAATLPGNR